MWLTSADDIVQQFTKGSIRISGILKRGSIGGGIKDRIKATNTIKSKFLNDRFLGNK